MKIRILDGAMGTMIQRAGLSEADFRGTILANHPIRLEGNNDLIALTRPDVLREIHRQYLEAGADIISTNTFNAQRISQAEYHTEGLVEDMNRAAARLARSEADRMTALTPGKPRYVAASIGPTSRTLSMSPDVENPALRALNFEELKAAYVEQMSVLAEEGVDYFLVETIFDTLNAKAALAAAREAMKRSGRLVPVMLSVTIADASGRMLSGQTLEAFVTTVGDSELLYSLGLNCSFGAREMRPYLRRLSTLTSLAISAHPNAGLPDEEGRYTETPESMAAAMKGFVDDGSVNIIGGCCGTTPDHIRALAAMAEGRPARTANAETESGWLAGLDAFNPAPDTFINVGERCNVAGSRKFLRLIKEKQYDEALTICRGQVDDGAMILDLNMDDGLLDAPAEMAHFLQLMASDPEVARIPWMIDSSRFEVVEAALRCVQGRAIVNSISLKNGEKQFLAEARRIKQYGAAMVVMAFDEEGQATTFERKVEVCSRAYRLLIEEAGIRPADIIFDPNILTVATGMKEHDRYALDFIEATRWIKHHLPGARVSGGVSNLSFAFRGNNYLREAMHAVFLYHAIAAGMDMAILNPATKVMVDDLEPQLREAIEDVVLYRRDDAAERLTAMAAALLEAGPTMQFGKHEVPADRSLIPLDRRLEEALRTGNDEHLEADLQEAIAAGHAPGALIEGPLMAGMQIVGRRFGEGKMFLPQVVKSARTMKKAVAILQPYIEAEKQQGEGRSGGRYLVATVKGDVHDIGKNIVAVVLGCNNFEVTDLGVMVPAEKIVRTILEKQIDFVSLSGLITPSLEEMRKTAEAMKEAGIRIPLFIGGATTSALHTALHIAPAYDGPVFYVKDASQNPVLALQLQGPDAAKIIAANRLRQVQLVRQHEAAKQARVASAPSAATPEEIDRCRLHLDWEAEERPKPSFLGCKTYHGIAIERVRPLINWIYFYRLWRVKPGSPEAAQIKAEADALLDRMAGRHTMEAQVSFSPAWATDHSLIVMPTEADEPVEILTPRQAAPAELGAPRLSLCDFIAPKGYNDYLGAFAVTASPPLVAEIEAARAGSDDFAALLLQSVTDRLAEATAEWLHREVRRTLWGYAPDEDLAPADLARAAYRGIRPAVGYPALPDQQEIFNVARLLSLPAIGIRLTENGAMAPQSSICGLLFANPNARYFAIVREE